MEQQVMTQAEFGRIQRTYKTGDGLGMLKTHTATCYFWPLRHQNNGNLVVTNKDFYAGIPDISEV